jgi:hypothetical protein
MLHLATLFGTQFMSKYNTAHEWHGETIVVGTLCGCAVTLQPTDGGIQVLFMKVPFIQTVVSFLE